MSYERDGPMTRQLRIYHPIARTSLGADCLPAKMSPGLSKREPSSYREVNLASQTSQSQIAAFSNRRLKFEFSCRFCRKTAKNSQNEIANRCVWNHKFQVATFFLRSSKDKSRFPQIQDQRIAANFGGAILNRSVSAFSKSQRLQDPKEVKAVQPIQFREGKWGRTKYKRIPESEGDWKGRVFLPEELFRTSDLEFPFFEGLANCSLHSMGYTRTFLHLWFPVVNSGISQTIRAWRPQKSKKRVWKESPRRPPEIPRVWKECTPLKESWLSRLLPDFGAHSGASGPRRPSLDSSQIRESGFF